MRAMTCHALSRLAIAMAVLVLLTRPAAAQERQVAVEAAGGALLFADDGGVVTEGFLGGAGRFYFLPRVAVGPELAFVQGDTHSHLILTGNVTFDLVGPVGGEPRSVTPFVVLGGGWFQTRQRFPNNETFTSGEGAFTAGGGVRALAGRRVFLGAEARIGWELHIRLNGFVGVRLRPR